ncbi:hypothetical protein E5082_23060 [Streptomyces griseoluteus]|uniref:Uncharacterized protein n=1 Tax=Streptomyces griseoluteus TaxID=29306 RepID=A0A4Z1DEJ8_STRGP|nr:hypothetical protein [Streptomyces griseoluteus]TGN80275.1 hypothetical protein E5082_23060 [Streptomyces griseoluteus]GHE95689.1 hypothetical protein GCM10017776_10320 [Streptomyces griseoluteus]
MNDLGDAHLRTWALRFMTLLAADPEDQLAWLGEQAVETGSVVEEALLLCRTWEGLVERGVGEPATLRDAGAIGRRLGDFADAPHAGLWAGELAAEPVWGDVRSLARQFLVTELGDWRQPLPPAGS